MSINNEERETKAARLQSDRQSDYSAIYVLISMRKFSRNKLQHLTILQLP
ncbi:hypothetical protein CES85_2016 [Ochrobactrum quorumnocens]|uniref:Uncharacterized protein n=1 Tax=Ochrobactrum quorumnocens TaxID=271865 RepID=A0A248UDY1_9HYPH|nr:hypothetical protein CES85_4783 [[Ochrobactrum] quorumnocens]ASV84822.1 hypothetical protein CES85_5620 [[Ochrobactrum] quorumnocens]ASV85323.1 hypothetical protein CES85_2382 [[Ochrobactrum] quorumnocens]ASV85932.1 hypothetical protein CES85_2016 [[Ochrobactrum] quorumnocens]